jgi:hypothetical protein
VAVRTGLSARLVRDSGRAPAVSLGMLDRRGERGRIGGGISVPPPALFVEAMESIGNSG